MPRKHTSTGTQNRQKRVKKVSKNRQGWFGTIFGSSRSHGLTNKRKKGK